MLVLLDIAPYRDAQTLLASPLGMIVIGALLLVLGAVIYFRRRR